MDGLVWAGLGWVVWFGARDCVRPSLLDFVFFSDPLEPAAVAIVEAPLPTTTSTTDTCILRITESQIRPVFG